MRFSIVSDIHTGPAGFYKGVKKKLTEHSLPLVKEFVDNVNKDPEIRFVVQLGDIIEDVNHDDDKKNFESALNLLKRTNCPVYHVIGNHDRRHLSQQELKNLIGHKNLYYSFDANDCHCVVLFSEALQDSEGGFISESQVEWLRSDLEKTNKRTLVFIHHSLSNQDLKGNFWFEGLPDECLVQNRKEVRKTLERSGKVVAVFSGHLHWNRMDIHNSIPYFTLQSLIENVDNNHLPSKSYAIVDMTERAIKVEIKGNDPETFRYGYVASRH